MKYSLRSLMIVAFVALALLAIAVLLALGLLSDILIHDTYFKFDP